MKNNQRGGAAILGCVISQGRRGGVNPFHPCSCSVSYSCDLPDVCLQGGDGGEGCDYLFLRKKKMVRERIRLPLLLLLCFKFSKMKWALNGESEAGLA